MAVRATVVYLSTFGAALVATLAIWGLLGGGWWVLAFPVAGAIVAVGGAVALFILRGDDHTLPGALMLFGGLIATAVGAVFLWFAWAGGQGT